MVLPVVILEATPTRVRLRLPRLKKLVETQEHLGFTFRVGDREQALCAAEDHDYFRCAQPWLQRFTSNEEYGRGFEDKVFPPHIPVEGQALMF
jgi:hypothetical protein